MNLKGKLVGGGESELQVKWGTSWKVMVPMLF